MKKIIKFLDSKIDNLVDYWENQEKIKKLKKINEIYLTACVNNKFETIKQSLILGADVNCFGGSGLKYCKSAINFIQIAEFLLTSPQLKEHYKIENKLMLDEIFLKSCEEGNLNMVNYCLNYPEFQNKNNEFLIIGHTGLKNAIMGDQYEVVRQLMNNSVLNSLNEEILQLNKNELLNIAIEYNRVFIAKKLIEEFNCVPTYWSKQKIKEQNQEIYNELFNNDKKNSHSKKIM